jgi:hypothetical protein
MIKNLFQKHSYKLAFTWAAVIFGLCSMPGRFIPSVSWLELLSFDKLVHASVFFILVSLLQISVSANQQNPKLVYLWFGLSVLYGGSLEIMQATVFSDRSADWLDMIANTFGCVMALVVQTKIRKLIFK